MEVRILYFMTHKGSPFRLERSSFNFNKNYFIKNYNKDFYYENE